MKTHELKSHVRLCIPVLLGFLAFGSYSNKATATETLKADTVASYGIDDINRYPVIHEVIDEPAPVKTKPKKEEEPIPLAMVEQKPQFPGGDTAMYSWISQNLVYPAAAAEEGASGRVVVSFIVEKDGSISNVRIIKGKHPALDAEAIRLVRRMPRWIPGRNNGHLVRVTYLIPINFHL